MRGYGLYIRWSKISSGTMKAIQRTTNIKPLFKIDKPEDESFDAGFTIPFESGHCSRRDEDEREEEF